MVYADIKKRFYNQFLEARKQKQKFNFTTDMLAHYKKGFTKYFFRVATLTHGVPIKCKKYGLTRNNNCIERDHQYSRAMEKNSRGHKDFDGISALFDVGDAYYNYIDKQKLMRKSTKEKRLISREKKWRTPAERAKIKLDLGNKFQLLKLIKKLYAKD